jgi:hypothetical protein
MSGDWYILLLMMKYACKGRAKGRTNNGRSQTCWESTSRYLRLTFLGRQTLSLVNDEERGRFSMNDGKLDADETSEIITMDRSQSDDTSLT